MRVYLFVDRKFDSGSSLVLEVERRVTLADAGRFIVRMTRRTTCAGNIYPAI